ncbi:MAG: GFA family protein [Actinobacteria bacterium]|nr:GFA family protein [Actinomycetota bacterium]
MTVLHGSCLCGGVTFEVSEAPETLRYCHCESCKKLSGGTGTLNGRVRSTSIRIIDGEDMLGTFEPSGGSAKTFCKKCGSNLFGGGWPDSETASVRASALDDEFAARPSAHLYVRSVAVWETLPDDSLERFETTSG